ncbi:unnamed protein product [Moneuplotes crassus]|uniref:BZIP domain-containing protein n=1 Tax=Euplotes crassus TaxID=5936 RepID=A0AAD2CWS7_EUPCR|nr:unnamed protein product [Moneuplotes crassus]
MEVPHSPIFTIKKSPNPPKAKATPQLEASLQSKPTKVRSQEYRDRKKQYVTKLEEINKKLIEENLYLKKENQELMAKLEGKGQTGPTKIDEKANMNRHEHFAYFKIPKMINDNPDSVRLTQISMAGKDISEWSPDRIQIIKKAFSDILNYMLAKDNKCFVAAFKNMKASQYIKKMKSKRTLKRKYKQLRKLEESHPEQIMLNMEYSESMMNYIEKSGPEYLRTCTVYKSLAKKLITIRNEILQAGIKREQYFEESGFIEALEKSDFSILSELIGRLDGTKYLSPHFLWDLPIRDPQSKEYNNCELSE